MNKYADKSLSAKNKLPIKETPLFVPQDTLDYHDRGVLLPYDIEQLLNDFLEDGILSAFKYVLVIVGKGKVVKPLVNKLLKTHKYVESYKQAGYFNGQEGAFEVILKS